MQLLGRDRIHQSFNEGDSILHELCSGNFQFGSGDESTIVTSMEQVAAFAPPIQAKVQAWLDAGGVNRAHKEKRELIMAEQAAKAPGTVDSLLDQLGDPELKGEIIEMLRERLNKGHRPETPPLEVVGQADHGVLVQREDGGREFVPNDSLMDEIIKQEQALDAEGKDRELVAVGAGDEPADSIHEDIQDSTINATRSAQRQVSGNSKGRTRR